MKFIVDPQKEERQERGCKTLYHTMCAQCSEDPRFCGDLW